MRDKEKRPIIKLISYELLDPVTGALYSFFEILTSENVNISKKEYSAPVTGSNELFSNYFIAQH